MSARCKETMWRAAKFYGIGAAGTAVQLIMLIGLHGIFGLDYLLATALAVEVSVIHNFIWHELFTWSDRRSSTTRQVLGRFARFNFSTGALSLVGNLIVMRVLVGQFRVPYLLANIAAIAACGIANFLLSDLWVFRQQRGVGAPARVFTS